jgi:hypothetical protein
MKQFPGLNKGIASFYFQANPFKKYSAAKLQKKSSTQSHEANTKITKIKNNNYPCLPLSSLCFLGAFMFKDFLPKKQRLYL